MPVHSCLFALLCFVTVNSFVLEWAKLLSKPRWGICKPLYGHASLLEWLTYAPSRLAQQNSRFYFASSRWIKLSGYVEHGNTRCCRIYFRLSTLSASSQQSFFCVPFNPFVPFVSLRVRSLYLVVCRFKKDNFLYKLSNAIRNVWENETDAYKTSKGYTVQRQYPTQRTLPLLRLQIKILYLRYT